MSIFHLTDAISFPPVEFATEEGILAVGGDLSPERLLKAYSLGIFPWYNEGEPILWWSPDPRFVLFPEEVYVSKTMRQVLRRGIFRIRCDQSFDEVVDRCRGPRKKQRGTWITPEMREAYRNLHELGYAHSVEAWREGHLAGGLYGVSLGGCFFGESMFSDESNASKTALISLALRLREIGFLVIDSQVYTAHLESLGAREIRRIEYLEILRRGLEMPTYRGSWEHLLEEEPAIP